MMYQFDQTVPSFEVGSDHHLYLFVDGGQIDHLAPLLYQIRDLKKLEPIYLHPPFNELKVVSPYLVEVTESVSQWFIAQNNPTAGFFFTSAWSLESICEHYRQLIVVLSPYGSQLYLKMAHSEAAWVLLESESQLFWHPLEKAWLPTRLGWQELNRPDFKTALPAPPLKLDDQQWAAMGDISWRNILESVDGFIRQYFSQLPAQQDNFDIWLNESADTAYQQGFHSEADQLHYFNIIGLLGESAVTDEQCYPDIYQLIHQASTETPSQRIARASELAAQYSHSSPTQKA
jgi:hypothetical protein